MSDGMKDLDVIYERIANSGVFRQFESAFESATGMPLTIRPVDSERKVPAMAKKSTEFCRILNQANRCPDCSKATHCLLHNHEPRPRSVTCFAGLSGAAVPVMAGQIPVAYISTGKVFAGERAEESFETVRKRLKEAGCSSEMIDDLEKSWFEVNEVSTDQYEGIVTLLAVFAGQLSEMSEKLIVAQQEAEPVTVVRARQYVSANMSERIGLNDVARHVNISPYHFCKVFKEATGFTFKQYLTRRRVECAKCQLRKPDVRITEVAYDVGFGSLSQFNRSFHHVVGESPSQWRSRELNKLAAV